MKISKILKYTRNIFGSQINCYMGCKNIVEDRGRGVIKKVINIYDPGCYKPWFYVEHPKGSYKQHCVVQDRDKIIDPFLEERGEIPIEQYKQIYKNPDEIKIVSL